MDLPKYRLRCYYGLKKRERQPALSGGVFACTLLSALATPGGWPR